LPGILPGHYARANFFLPITAKFWAKSILILF
jgi:hypothetical protein